MTDLDYKHCVNCCADLEDKENESESAFYTLNWTSRVQSSKNSRAASVEQVSVHQALSKIFNFKSESDETNPQSQPKNQFSTSSSVDKDDASSLPICFVCHLVLNDLYRTYTEFNQLRKTNSYLNKRLKCESSSSVTGFSSRGASTSSASDKRRKSLENNFPSDQNVDPEPVPLDVKIEVFGSDDEEEEEYETNTLEYTNNIEDSRLVDQESSNLSVQVANSMSESHSSATNVTLCADQPTGRRNHKRKSHVEIREDPYPDYLSFSSDITGNDDQDQAETDVDPLDLLTTVDSDTQDQTMISNAFKTERANHLGLESDGSNRFYFLSPDGSARLLGHSVAAPVNRILSSRVGKDGKLKINYRDHYDFPSGVGEGKATCKICHQIVARKKCSTASMRSHLFRRHKMRFHQITS